MGTTLLVIAYVVIGVFLGERINLLCGKLVRYLSFMLVLLTVYDVMLRYLFQSGSVATQELEWHIFAALFLLGGGYTYARDEHVRVDIFYAGFSARRKAFVDIFGTLFALLPFTAVVIWAAVPFVERSYEILERSSDPGGLPYRFLVKGLILGGFLLLGLQGLAVLGRNLRFLFSSSGEGSGGGQPQVEAELSMSESPESGGIG